MEKNGSRPAHVWALRSYRAGETTQITGLATALEARRGLRFRELAVRYRACAGAVGLARRVTLHGVDAASAAMLAPPWPDLLISSGLRNEPLARWVRRESGGRTRIVFLGRTWAPPAAFDLIVTTPQYRLPAVGNVLENATTQHALDATRLAEARARFAGLFVALPAPRIGVLVGGDAGPYALRAPGATRLLEAVAAVAAPHGAGLMVTTSARTHRSAVERLQSAAGPATFVHAYGTGVNPYEGILAWADALVVTADSIAMLSEALATGVPVALFDPAEHGDGNLRTFVYRALQRLGPRRLTRDVTLVHARLAEAGRIVPLAELLAPRQRHAAGTPVPADADVERTVHRIAALLVHTGA